VGPRHPIWAFIAVYLILRRLSGGCARARPWRDELSLQGLIIERVGPPGEDEGSRGAVTVVTLRVVVREKVGGSCSVGYLF
jgi:hypothetical protein